MESAREPAVQQPGEAFGDRVHQQETNTEEENALQSQDNNLGSRKINLSELLRLLSQKISDNAWIVSNRFRRPGRVPETWPTPRQRTRHCQWHTGEKGGL